MLYIYLKQLEKNYYKTNLNLAKFFSNNNSGKPLRELSPPSYKDWFYTDGVGMISIHRLLLHRATGKRAM